MRKFRDAQVAQGGLFSNARHFKQPSQHVAPHERHHGEDAPDQQVVRHRYRQAEQRKKRELRRNGEQVTGALLM